jgi:hypothetical protein
MSNSIFSSQSWIKKEKVKEAESLMNKIKEKYPDVKISLTCNYQWRGLTDGSYTLAISGDSEFENLPDLFDELLK